MQAPGHVRSIQINIHIYSVLLALQASIFNSIKNVFTWCIVHCKIDSLLSNFRSCALLHNPQSHGHDTFYISPCFLILQSTSHLNFVFCCSLSKLQQYSSRRLFLGLYQWSHRIICVLQQWMSVTVRRISQLCIISFRTQQPFFTTSSPSLFIDYFSSSGSHNFTSTRICMTVFSTTSFISFQMCPHIFRGDVHCQSQLWEALCNCYDSHISLQERQNGPFERFDLFHPKCTTKTCDVQASSRVLGSVRRVGAVPFLSIVSTRRTVQFHSSYLHKMVFHIIYPAPICATILTLLRSASTKAC